MLPTIIASSVIRSTHRGDSHGGIYRVNLETNEAVQMLDWNNPEINWDGRGGDRGIRGLAFFGHTLYAVAGNELFAFEQDGDFLIKVASYPSRYLSLTHECWRHKEKLYICSGGTDSILVFDLVSREWTTSYYHNSASIGAKSFDPNNNTEYPTPTNGFMHLDSVYANDDYMWYCGAFTDKLWRLDLNTGQTIGIQLQISDTHNARPRCSGYIYNLSRYSETVFESGGKIQMKWKTPVPDLSTLINTHLPQDCAVTGYTRGMVIYKNYIIVGTSPAAINVFKIDIHQNENPIKTIQLTNDLRNSICGMALYEW
jgi:hypothetical protein